MIDSIPARVAALVVAQGGYIKYCTFEGFRFKGIVWFDSLKYIFHVWRNKRININWPIIVYEIRRQRS